MRLRLLLPLLALPAAFAAEPKAMPRPSVLVFPGDDGYEMTGVYYPPPGRQAPAVLCVHGLGHTARSWGGLPARLQALGYAVLAVNLRGHPEDVAKGRRRLNWLQFELPQFKAMAKDIEAARACLAAQREVDVHHLGLLGEEFGANLALAGGGNEAFRTAALLTPRLDARGIPGPETLAAFGQRSCLAVASADDAQGAATLEALKGAAKGRFEPLLLPADASEGDFGAAMLGDEGKKDLTDRILAWFRETLPVPQAAP